MPKTEAGKDRPKKREQGSAALVGRTVSPVVAADMATVAAEAKVETETNIDSMSSASTFKKSESEARNGSISEQRNHDSVDFINNRVHGCVQCLVQLFENHLEIP